MAVYITGDCHGEFNKFSTKRFPDQKELTKDDFVIVCGDYSNHSKSRDNVSVNRRNGFSIDYVWQELIVKKFKQLEKRTKSSQLQFRI